VAAAASSAVDDDFLDLLERRAGDSAARSRLLLGRFLCKDCDMAYKSPPSAPSLDLDLRGIFFFPVGIKFRVDKAMDSSAVLLLAAFLRFPRRPGT
jgi:hypothetical protein